MLKQINTLNSRGAAENILKTYISKKSRKNEQIPRFIIPNCDG